MLEKIIFRNGMTEKLCKKKAMASRDTNPKFV